MHCQKGCQAGLKGAVAIPDLKPRLGPQGCSAPKEGPGVLIEVAKEVMEKEVLPEDNPQWGLIEVFPWGLRILVHGARNWPPFLPLLKDRVGHLVPVAPLPGPP